MIIEQAIKRFKNHSVQMLWSLEKISTVHNVQFSFETERYFTNVMIYYRGYLKNTGTPQYILNELK